MRFLSALLRILWIRAQIVAAIPNRLYLEWQVRCASRTQAKLLYDIICRNGSFYATKRMRDVGYADKDIEHILNSYPHIEQMAEVVRLKG